MPNKMLIDATHPEETRVVVLRGNRVEEFDFESASRKQLRGNIYLAKVTRVEPSLQAAFVDYGGNRHGFLAFSEIHPDYYQIPVADRQALLEEERLSRDDDENGNGESRGGRRRGRHRNRRRGADRNRSRNVKRSEPIATDATPADEFTSEDTAHETVETSAGEVTLATENTATVADTEFGRDNSVREEDSREQADAAHDGDDRASAEQTVEPVAAPELVAALPTSEEVPLPVEESSEAPAQPEIAADKTEVEAKSDDNGNGENDDEDEEDEEEDDDDNGEEEEEEVVESVGGDAMEEVQERTPRYRRHYKIQEVIKRRQVMLVQVVKEERGTKGAALTSYLSLAGRYSVLMPNTARGGGISRKVTSAEDRKKMKEVAEELDVPEGMGVILRTAGASRTKTEIKRDFEYLLRLWENVRDLTLKSTAPTLVYEEGSLVKRSIRDLYHSDIDDIIVEGEPAYREAKDFMRMLMPSHAKNVHLYHDGQPIFTRYGIEPQLDAMFSSTVQLKSGGYIVINQAEALVAIDVNSGRATREHSIEETALKTNSEAAVEIARQLRLRDLAGLIVIDFIDMDENRNNRSVERKTKEALKSDRARIQVGRISHFGLLEMSRQRIRSSVLESSTEICPHCSGTGHVRSVSSVALQLVRSLEETLLKGATHNLIVRTRSDVAIYVLNHKRAHLRALEERFRVAITITSDPTLTGHPPFAIDRGEQVMTLEQARALVTVKPDSVMPYAEEEEEDEHIEEETEEAVEAGAEADSGETSDADGEQSAQNEGRGRRRRRGRRGRGGRSEGRDRGEAPLEAGSEQPFPSDGDENGDRDAEGETQEANGEGGEPRGEENGEGRRRRRGRRGGRRNRRGRDENDPRNGQEHEGSETSADRGSEQPDESPAFDTPPSQEQPREEYHPVETVVTATETVVTEEKPRRRSTVREAAPKARSDSDTPPSAPAESAPTPAPAATDEAASTDKPRRFGWWSRKT